jgi:hypothetical protein
MPSNSITIVMAASDSAEASGSPGSAEGDGVGVEGFVSPMGTPVAKEDVGVAALPSLPPPHPDSAAARTKVAGSAPSDRTRLAEKAFLAVFLMKR